MSKLSRQIHFSRSLQDVSTGNILSTLHQDAEVLHHGPGPFKASTSLLSMSEKSRSQVRIGPVTCFDALPAVSEAVEWMTEFLGLIGRNRNGHKDPETRRLPWEWRRFSDLVTTKCLQSDASRIQIGKIPAQKACEIIEFVSAPPVVSLCNYNQRIEFKPNTSMIEVRTRFGLLRLPSLARVQASSKNITSSSRIT